jgi:hypothetical protein
MCIYPGISDSCVYSPVYQMYVYIPRYIRFMCIYPVYQIYEIHTGRCVHENEYVQLGPTLRELPKYIVHV